MKILLPVDGSDLSLHETRFALQLLREGLKASFVLANVQEPASFYEIVTADDPALIEDAALEAAEELMEPSARLLPTVLADAFEVVNGMLDLIELHGCDMVLMGSRARGPLRRLVEGASVSRRLIDDAPVPVLLVKPPQEG